MNKMIHHFEDNECPVLLEEADLLLAEINEGMALDLKAPHVPSGPVIISKAAKAPKAAKPSAEAAAAAKAAAKAYAKAVY